MEQLIPFLQASPTPWHAVAQMETILLGNEFTMLSEASPWDLSPGKGYVVTRQPGALVAFILPTGYPETLPPIHLTCAHTDSPGLKLKPMPCKRKGSHLVWDVEVYGSPLLSTWFDRDLGLAGQITLIHPELGVRHRMIHDREATAILPSLAIHLNREANDGTKIRRHDDLSPIILPDAVVSGQEPIATFQSWVKLQMERHFPAEDWHSWEPIAWDLSLIDCTPPRCLGGESGWLTGGRLDNLLACLTGVLAITSPSLRNQGNLPILACFNHEESGSLSPVGAQGNLVPSVLRRLFPQPDYLERILSRSTLVSVDAAHALHPNFSDKYDSNNAPELNAGLVFKHNANQRYAHSPEAEGMLKGLCRTHGIPWQDFAMRADMPCGSTIGPMLAANLGMRAVDLGVATWAMHSIRETAGLADIANLQSFLTHFFASEG
ncbi:MAG: M18 family aminopeptidase [Magnetococcales bacterium]|nr:M18 family aminopeptidase [Magnetococcales bacterium]